MISTSEGTVIRRELRKAKFHINKMLKPKTSYFHVSLWISLHFFLLQIFTQDEKIITFVILRYDYNNKIQNWEVHISQDILKYFVTSVNENTLQTWSIWCWLEGPFSKESGIVVLQCLPGNLRWIACVWFHFVFTAHQIFFTHFFPVFHQLSLSLLLSLIISGLYKLIVLIVSSHF